MEILIVWILFALLPAIIAPSRGRSGFGWFLLSIVISPLFGLILVLALPSKRAAIAAPVRVVAVDDPAAGDVKTCPQCAEQVKAAARVCRFCRHEFA